MINLPIQFEERMKKLLKDDFEDFVNSLQDKPVKAFRVNTEKISVKDFQKINIFSKDKIAYVENGFYTDYDKIGNHPYHHAGMIYVQEPAAMAPVEAIEIDKKWNVLDMCAAPGGKSSQIRNKLDYNSVLVSNEIVSNRCKVLTGNIERLGFKNCITTCMDTKRLACVFENCFDMVLVDAPCSGEGMFRKEQAAIDCWSEENVISCAKRQANILDDAATCLKKGGYIVYSTCTYSLEENEMVIDAFLQKYSNFELVPVNEKLNNFSVDGLFFDGCKTENINFCKRFYPHKNRGEGQFVAILHNTEKSENFIVKSINKVKADKMVYEFLDSVLTYYDKESVFMYNNNPVYYSGNFNVHNLSSFSFGVNIGEIKKNYILPHHQFFMSLGNRFKNKIELTVDSDELAKYLHGEAFQTNAPDGWAVVTVNGCTVGGVKVSGSVAKNHYPKGLRTL
ncbi:MAG: NOL1/NOP2/sun family putative RNA methylase [Acutalibacteraceae bacterium]|nr:NOL1/NOP2/sun family putative RNA methylase [Acutalibacteraceae bacterium]